MKYRLQSMYNHTVGRAGSVPSPLYSILIVLNLYPGSSEDLEVWSNQVQASED